MGYERSFLIFSPEDKGFGSGQEPSGFLKIEINGGKGKLEGTVRNLRRSGGIAYRLMIIRCVESDLTFASDAPFLCDSGKGDFRWEFNPDNVSGTGLPMKEFNVFAIVAEGKDAADEILSCPLAAYRGNKPDWRKSFLESRRRNRSAKISQENGEMDFGKAGIPYRVPWHQSSKAMEGLHEKGAGLYGPDENGLTADPGATSWGGSIAGGYGSEEPPMEQGQFLPQDDGIQREGEDGDRNEGEGERGQDAQSQGRGAAEGQDSLKGISEYGFNSPGPDSPVGLNGSNEFNSPGLKRPEEGAGKNMVPPCCKSGGSPWGYYPCHSCTFADCWRKVEENDNRQVNVEELCQLLDKNFESMDPFRSRRRDYRWWKVASPVQLNNIFFHCNLKTPILFSQSIMGAYFKYRYLIAGLYSDRVRGREYIVCGAPAEYSNGVKPFGEMSRWVQLEGSRPRLGAFGYWLVYIDSRDGKLLKVN